MSVTPSITGISIIVFIVMIQCIIALFLFNKYFKNRHTNIFYLALFNLIAGIVLIFSALTVYTNNIILYLIYLTFVFSSNIFLVLFIQNTFYKDKKSPLKIFLMILILIFTFQLVIIGLNPDLFEMVFFIKFILSILYSSEFLITGVWMAKISLREYKKYKPMPLSPWIKKRYLLSGILAISHALIGYHYLIYIFGIIDEQNPNLIIIYINLLYSVVLLIIFSVGSLITWVMPGKLKVFFDRKFKPVKEVDLSEEEIEQKFLEK